MRRIAAAALAFTFALHTAPMFAAQGTGAISGTAQNSAGQTLGNFTVQLRSVETGQLVGSTTSNAAGSFSFAGLNPGSFVVEVVNAAGQIVGTSSAVAISAGAAASVTVTAAAAASLLTSAGISTALVITTVAAGAGVTGIVVAATKDDASPSR